MIRTSVPTVGQKAHEIGPAKIEQGRFCSERPLMVRAIEDMLVLGKDERHRCPNVPPIAKVDWTLLNLKERFDSLVC
jgi:hypothetical protein